MKERAESPLAIPVWITVLAILAGILVNAGLNAANNALSLPFFFDSIATATAAAILGLVPGILVAIGTNLMIEALTGFPWVHLPFAICGIATALIVWGFVRRGSFDRLGGVLFASLLVALANALLGGTIATFVYGGVTGVGVDYLVTGFVAAGQSIVSATFWARVPANLVDKTIAVLVAYAALMLVRRFSRAE